jgi:ADP-heptose:LPS heptosyltransferase
MRELIALFGTAPVMLTTDSGPMHLANALGVHTVALEGASDERNTAPYNAQKRSLIRYGQLPCEPCVKNTCQFGIPTCLMKMDNEEIVQAVLTALTLYNK